MSALVDAVNHLLHIPNGTLGKLKNFSDLQSYDTGMGKYGGGNNTPEVDILETPKDYAFLMDVPGLSKSDIQVTVEDKNTLVIKSSGKRKREEGEEEGCRYMILERKPHQKFARKFRLPEDANVSAISAKCENGVLTIVVEKLPPPPKPKSKTVEVAIS